MLGTHLGTAFLSWALLGRWIEGFEFSHLDLGLLGGCWCGARKLSIGRLKFDTLISSSRLCGDFKLSTLTEEIFADIDFSLGTRSPLLGTG